MVKQLEVWRAVLAESEKNAHRLCPTAVVKKVNHAMFQFPASSSGSLEPLDGAGFFFKPNRAVTCNHALPSRFRQGDTVLVQVPSLERTMELKVLERDTRLDFAILEPVDELAPDFLEILTGYQPFLEGNDLVLFTFVDDSQLPRVPGGWNKSPAVMKAVGLRVSSTKHHLLFDSNTWTTNDCGAALLLFDGRVAALSVDSVAHAKDLIRQKLDMDESLTDLEKSIQRLIGRVPGGQIGLLASVFADR
ncbi:hypothetical protein KFL_008000040 [Klebsormidium nitens]|uniref:Trypsin family protein n=1 Tax=Klebsormidium nitens TaxID=105231 RepID=A0A1Y1ILH9_KLENI|nr:hypothetical protein KFL_008000040 [Klebsormidium nitens]|eukprot:GAQ91523.1 hypothetical protein KFL_008000040 [Klebsormidium nitens]